MSLPTPPSGILDKDRPWYRGRISDAQWDRLKAKLTGGTDAGGTSYSKFIDCTQSEADKIISNLKKDPRGYPQMYMPGGGESYQIMIDFYQWLKDSYLYDDPKPEPEEIPVEVEVVEVEQKTVDEPIIVKIEAPFESTPEVKLSAPKRIRLPRRGGIITPTKVKKQSVADRMAEGFTENLLDPLLDSIQNPPAPAPPKQRKQKETLVKIKKAVKPTSSKFKSNFKESSNVKPFENLTAFLGKKVKSGLGRAADARRMATEMGMPEQKKGFYATRALGFEFGGDAIARARGTFAKSPDATLDPSLTKQQRYVQGMFGTRTIRGASNFDKKIAEVSKRFDGLQKNFDNVIKTKKSSPSSSDTVDQFNKTVEEIRDALKKGNKLQKGINEAKKDQAKLAADAANDAEMDAKEASMEQQEDNASLKNIEKAEQKKEEKKKGGGFNPFDFLKRFKGLRKLWRRIRNPVRTFKAVKRLVGQKINKALRPVKDLAANLKTKGKKVVDGAVEIGKRLKGGALDAAGKATDAVKGGVTKVGNFFAGIGSAIKGGAVRAWDATTSFAGWIGQKARAAGDLIASAPGKIGNQLKKLGVPKNWDELAKLARSDIGQKGIMLAMGPIGKYVIDQITNPKSALKVAQRGIMNKKVQMAIIKRGGRELLEKVLAKLGVKVGGQAVPGFGQVINLGYGIIEAIVRGVMGDLKGSALSLGGAIPWVGAGFSIIDIIRDIDTEAYTKHIEPNLGSIALGSGDPLVSFFNEVAGTDISTSLNSDPPEESKGGEEEPTPMNRGGVLAMTGEAGNELIIDPRSGGYNPLQSLAPIIVAMRELTKRSGPWAGPIYNFVKQTTDPIAKELNLPVTPVKSDLGGVGGEQKEMKMISRGSGGFGGILDAIGALFGGGGGVAAPQTSGAMSATLSGTAAELVGSDHEFLAEVKRLSQKYQIKEGDLLGLMASESGLNPQARNKSGATGLIQFMPNTARELGTSTSAIYGMNRAQQMKYVEKYFDYWKLPRGATAGQLYATVFAPAYASKDPSTPMYRKSDGAAYSQNIGLDANEDGVITVGELGGRIEDKKKAFGISDSGMMSSPSSPGSEAPVIAPPSSQSTQPATITPPRPQTPAPAPAQSSQGTPKVDIVSIPGLSPQPAPRPDPAAPLSDAELNQVFRGASLSDIMRARLAQ